jgi:hypothetical protein
MNVSSSGSWHEFLSRSCRGILQGDESDKATVRQEFEAQVS